MRVENDLINKRKEKVDKFTKDNQKLKEKLSKGREATPQKPSRSEVDKVKREIEEIQKQIEVQKKKNRDIQKKKETEGKSAKLETKQLNNKLDEINKIYRINLHKISENERRIKFGIFDKRGVSTSQININSNKISSLRGSKSQVRQSNLDRFRKSSVGRRDLSAANNRFKQSPVYGGANMNSSYINSSMETSTSNVYGLKTQKSKKKLKDVKTPIKRELSNLKINQTVDEVKPTQENTELRELKGLKIGQKKTIETSVNL